MRKIIAINVRKLIIGDEKKISMALMSSFAILTIQYFIIIYFNLSQTTDGSRLQLLAKILVGIVYLYALPAVLRRNKINFIGVFLLAACVFAFQYLIFSENSKYINGLLFTFFGMCLPTFIYSLSIHDFKEFKKDMRKVSYVVFTLGTILGVLILIGKASIDTYSMSLSYYMLLPTIMFIDELLDKFSILKLILTLVSLFVILSFGSRGAILCAIVFTLLKFMRPSVILNYSRLLGYTVAFGIGFLLYQFIDQILVFVYKFLLNNGINSRSIALFLGDPLHSSGRDIIYDKIMNAISNHPLFGNGVAGDRLILDGMYAHNFFLEIICDFGIFFGLAISLVLVFLIIKSLVSKDIIKYNMISIWICLGFVPLMVSGSYLTDMKFWIFWGILCNSYSSKNQKKIIYNHDNNNYTLKMTEEKIDE